LYKLVIKGRFGGTGDGPGLPTNPQKKKKKKSIKKNYLKAFGPTQKIKISIWSLPIQLFESVPFSY
jgi:hypothetical protein